MNDQPMTCPKCGNRTDILFDLDFLKEPLQIHQCLTSGCKKIFVAVEDEEFSNYLKLQNNPETFDERGFGF